MVYRWDPGRWRSPDAHAGSINCARTAVSMLGLSAGEQGDLTPLVQTVRRWWFEAIGNSS
jgi:hypothetical protein